MSNTSASSALVPKRWPIILATIDVEASHGARPFEQMILGQTDQNQEWGVFKIAEILEQYGATGTFYVDVYEDVFWGEDKMKALCQQLDARGHDVQLHTHPSWRRDPRDSDDLNDFKQARTRFPPEKDFMAKLSFEEQRDFLLEGKKLLESWLGKPVQSHRSGGYSINGDTVRALTTNGITIDSSMNRSHSNSKLTWSDNKVVCKEGLFEFPVSYYNLFAFPGAPKILQRLMKTDLDSTPLHVLQKLTLDFEKRELRTFHLFMHSFTLLDIAPDFSSFGIHQKRVERLHGYLKFAKDHDFSVCSVSDATRIENWEAELLNGDDYIPQVAAPGFWFNLVKLRLRRAVFMKSRK